MPFRLTALLAGAFFLLWSSTSAAQEGRRCAPRKDVSERLAKKYGEVPVFRGISGTKGMVEVFLNEKSGTFTVLVTQPTQEKLACMVDAGTAGMILKPHIPEGPET